MDGGFWLRVALSVVLTGASVAAFTAVAERQGSRVGGLLLTLPVKVAIAMVLIGVNEGAAFAGEAARAVPAGIAANVVFVAGTTLLLRRLGPLAAVAGAFGVWLVVSALILFTGAPGPLLGLLYWLPAAGVATWLLHRITALRPVQRGTTPAGRRGLVVRALAAGGLVGTALVLARTIGSTAAGLASIFPSSWLLALYVLARDQGPDMAGATGRVMVVGSAAPALFGAVCAAAFATMGLWAGVLLALAASAAATFAGRRLLVWMGRGAPHPQR